MFLQLARAYQTKSRFNILLLSESTLFKFYSDIQFCSWQRAKNDLLYFLDGNFDFTKPPERRNGGKLPQILKDGSINSIHIIPKDKAKCKVQNFLKVICSLTEDHLILNIEDLPSSGIRERDNDVTKTPLLHLICTRKLLF